MESMADILSDSLVVAPLIQSGDLHSSPLQRESAQQTIAAINSKTYFYVFLHQVWPNPKSTDTIQFNACFPFRLTFHAMSGLNQKFTPNNFIAKIDCMHCVRCDCDENVCSYRKHCAHCAQ